jgi:soluble lytic murein transglycosylase
MARRHLAWLIALAGCSVGAEAGHPAASSAAPVPSASAEAAVAKADAEPKPPPVDDWREAARRLDWKRAHALLSALPAEERSSPEMRLAFGRIALGAGEHAAAVEALEGLDAILPLAADEARRWYAEAAAVAGPHDTAASFLARSAKVRDLLEAGRALERAEKNGEARKLYDKAIQRAERTRRRDEEMLGHLFRARLAEKLGDKAVAGADYRWLVRERPGEQETREALAGLDRVGGSVGLDERLTALWSSCTQDNVEATLATLDELAKKHTASAAIDFARAKALYQARDYARAKTAFDVVRKVTSPFAAESFYFGAQATARSGSAEEALALYRELTSRFASSMYAERAAYRQAELLSLSGKHKEAAEAFARYLSRFGRGGHVTDARFGQAVALLSAGEPAKARKIFANLRLEGEKGWREGAHHQHLEALAAARAGDVEGAKKLWLELLREQPLTYPAMAAHARLKALGHEPLPPLIAEGAKSPAKPPLGTTMPTAPALLVSLGLDLAAEQRLEAIEDDAAKSYPGRESEALCSLYGQLAGAERRAAIANRAVSLESLMKPPSAADRWTWECIYPRPYGDIVREQEAIRKVPAGLVHAVMRQESFFRTTVTSPAGARGLMQLMPNTAARVGGEIGLAFDPEEIVRPDLNVALGTFYLGKLLRNFGGHPALATASYNAGPMAVARWLEGGEREADLFVARIPFHETRQYVQRVLSNFARYQYLSGGVEAITPLELALPATVDIGDDAY